MHLRKLNLVENHLKLSSIFENHLSVIKLYKTFINELNESPAETEPPDNHSTNANATLYAAR